MLNSVQFASIKSCDLKTWLGYQIIDFFLKLEKKNEKLKKLFQEMVNTVIKR